MMLSLLAQLQVIDESLYEAAQDRRGEQLAVVLAHYDAPRYRRPGRGCSTHAASGAANSYRGTK
jgi:hypothetical protein